MSLALTASHSCDRPGPSREKGETLTLSSKVKAPDCRSERLPKSNSTAGSKGREKLLPAYLVTAVTPGAQLEVSRGESTNGTSTKRDCHVCGHRIFTRVW